MSKLIEIDNANYMAHLKKERDEAMSQLRDVEQKLEKDAKSYEVEKKNILGRHEQLKTAWEEKNDEL